MKKILLLTLFLSFNVSAFSSLPPPYYLLRIASEVSGIPLKGYGEDLDILIAGPEHPSFKEHEGTVGLFSKRGRRKLIIIRNDEHTTYGDIITRLIHESVHYLQDPNLKCAGLPKRLQLERDAYIAENVFRKKYGKDLDIPIYDESEYDYLTDASSEVANNSCA
jgi:hypothetical protein